MIIESKAKSTCQYAWIFERNLLLAILVMGVVIVAGAILLRLDIDDRKTEVS